MKVDAKATDVPPVDVLVLNFNGRKHLDSCLQSLKQQTYPQFTVTFLDNGSSDGSALYVSSQYPWVRVRALGENLGYSRAYNLGIKESQAALVALLNNDAFVASSWLQELVEAMLAHPQVAACTSRIRFAEHPAFLHHAGAMLTHAGAGWDIGYGQPDSDAYDVARFVGSFSGAAALLRRDVFLQCGGFDRGFFAYCEDTDLSWRLWLLGHRILYVPTAIAYHSYGATGGGRLSHFRVYHAQRNRLASMVKNASATRLPLAVTLSLGFDLFRCLNYARMGRFSLLSALAAGTSATLRELRALLAQRSRTQQQRLVSDKELEAWGVLASPLAAVREYLRVEGLALKKAPEGTAEARRPGRGKDSPLVTGLERR